METVKALDPVVDSTTGVLVLGTLPSAQSLLKQQYYGNPRNQLWRVLSGVLDAEFGSTYEQRISLLQQHGIGLWDVLAEAEREGSSDTTIRSEKPNSLAELLAKYPNIRCIALNGKHALEYFETYISSNIAPSITVLPLPSTSPQNRTPLNEKVDAWKALRRCINATPTE